MIFNETTYYLLFLLPTVLLFHGLRRAWRPWALTLMGALFFAYYGHVHFGGAWGAACVGIFAWEAWFSRLYRPGSRWCVVGIFQAVGFLVVFKYLPFLTSSWNDLASLFPLPTLSPAERLVIPLGLSFFTFEFIHFAAESYRGSFRRPRMVEYAAFIFFFPTMVAGPIKRFHEFERQLAHARFSERRFAQGATRILTGLAKKHVLADTFTLWSDHLNTDAIRDASPLSVLGWVLAYGMKIYFDFSGYSDIALGSANLLGMRFPENFNWPYLSRNIAEFWRHWHISLGRWIFDYVYIPLGGSRGSAARGAANLVMAFFISGLWHGAAYNYVLWGLWHGLLSVLLRGWTATAGRAGVVLPAPVAIAATFMAVHIGWLLFAMDTAHLAMLAQRVMGATG